MAEACVLIYDHVSFELACFLFPYFSPSAFHP